VVYFETTHFCGCFTPEEWNVYSQRAFQLAALRQECDVQWQPGSKTWIASRAVRIENDDSTWHS